MSAAPTNPTGTVPTGGPPGELAGGVLGLPSVLFCIVTGAAPLDGDAVQRPGRHARRRLGLARGVPRRHDRADDLLGRLHRDVPAGDARRVASTRSSAAGSAACRVWASGFLIALCYIIFSAAVIGRDGLLRVDHRRDLHRRRPPRLGLHGDRPGADEPARVVPHRAHREGPRGHARRRGARARRAGGRGSSPTGGAEGFSLAPFNPANIFDNSARGRGVRRRRRGHRALRARSGRGSASRWPRTTPRSPATRTGSPRSPRTAR